MAGIRNSKGDIFFSHVPFINRTYHKGIKRKIYGLEYRNRLGKFLKKHFRDLNRSPENASFDPETLEITKGKAGIDLDYKDIGIRMIRSFEEDPSERTFKIDLKRYRTYPKVKTKNIRRRVRWIKENVKDAIVAFNDASITLTRHDLIQCVERKNGRYTILLPETEKLIKSICPQVRPGKARVKTVSGRKTLTNYAYEFPVDTKRTAKAVKAAIRGKTYEAEGYYSDTPKTDTRVEVDLGGQTVYLISNGKKKLVSSCVTGTAGHRTPTGIYRIAYKSRNTTLKGRNDDGSKYESFVRYWMPFNGGIGLHDADWRSSFGGSIYLNNGSHGCVNMPIPKAAKLYENVQAGTLVYVY